MSTFATETIVERKGDNALERMVHKVLHHGEGAEQAASPSPPSPASAGEGAQADEQAREESLAVTSLLPSLGG